MLLSQYFVIFVCFMSTLFSFSVFLKGFMPSKKGLPGLATTTTKLTTNPNFGNGTFLNHKRLVILMIDALRADFVLGYKTHMNFTSALINRRDTVSLILKSQPPTVTLPRIKAITTGGIPGFVDVVLNFDTTVLNEDNLLAQFKKSGKTLIFFGDDTWMKLFPDVFTRADGTTSFFVLDYTEVDRNVSRHLDAELEREDWHVMILHYLGLDHIGHMSGPKSPLVKPKLQEMDRVVEKLYNKLLKQAADGHGDSLLLLCGDHGMTDQGGHGGSSENEVTTPAVFISTKFTKGKGLIFNKDKTAQQIDLTPSLALLFGLPIPNNNLGMLIPEVFIGASTAEMVKLYEENAKQLWKVLQWNFPNTDNDRLTMLYEEVLDSVEVWWTSMDKDLNPAKWEKKGRSLVREFQDVIRKMQEKAALALANYDLYAMVLGILFLWLVVFNVTLYLKVFCDGFRKQIYLHGLPVPTIIVMMSLSIVCHVTVCTSEWGSSMMCGRNSVSLILQIFSLMIVSLLTTLAFIAIQQPKLPVISGINKDKTKQILFNGSWCEKWLICGSLLHSLSLMSSSFVEEEHQTWYFFLTTFHIVALLQVVATNLQSNHISPTASQKNLELKRKTGSNCLNSMTKVNQVLKKEQQQYSGSEDTTKTSEEYMYLSELQLSQGGALLASDSESHTPNQQSCDMTIEARLKARSSKEVVASKPDNKGYQVFSTDIKVLTDILLILVLGRVARSLNQTGNKWLDQPDLGDWLVSPENKTFLTCVVTVSMVIIVVLRGRPQGLVKILLCFGMLGVYSFRAANQLLWLPEEFRSIFSDKGGTEACFVYANVGLIILESVWTYKTVGRNLPTDIARLFDRLHTSWILLMVLLMRPHNILLTALITIQERLVSGSLIPQLHLSTPALTLYYYWMGQATFFYQGNSNSVSTVDVSAGYTGLAQYNSIIIGLLMALSTYSGVTFWMLSFLKEIKPRRQSGDVLVASLILLMSRSVPLSLYTLLVYIQRYHLFVWTVFSPKLLYEGMLSLVITVYTACLTII